jgi:hypothetical protein
MSIYEASTGTDLVFNLAEGSLKGEIDGLSINAYASSGGRGGSKTKGVVNYLMVNNPYGTGVKKGAGNSKKAAPGGAIPMGKYNLSTHENVKDRPNWIRVLPQPGTAMKGRDGMAIHGRGPRGSDGCIVPTDFNIVKMLYQAIRKREEANKPAPTLAVVAIGDIDRFESRIA